MDDTDDPEIEVEVSRDGDATVVAVTGELDAASTPTLAGPLAEAGSAQAVVLDLSEVEFVDSTGLHAIIDAREALQGRGGRFALCCVEGGPVARVIEVALPGMLELHPTRAAAVDAVSA